MERSWSILALAMTVTACLGSEPPPDESAAASASLLGDILDPDILKTIAYRPTGFLSLSTEARLEVTDSHWDANGDEVRTITVRGERHALEAPAQGIMRLSAQSLSIGDALILPFAARSQLAMAIYHRPWKSRHAWRPLRCVGIHDQLESMPQNVDYDLYNQPVTIDMAARTIKTALWFNPLFDPTPKSDTFERCGIKERDPEFAVFVVPSSSWNIIGTPLSLQGRYRYSLGAVCDNNWCVTYGDGDDARAADESAGPDPANRIEECWNASDDDGDGKVDCDDPECQGYVEWHGRPGAVRYGTPACPDAR